jgi:hypothetical protein
MTGSIHSTHLLASEVVKKSREIVANPNTKRQNPFLLQQDCKIDDELHHTNGLVELSNREYQEILYMLSAGFLYMSQHQKAHCI